VGLTFPEIHRCWPDWPGHIHLEAFYSRSEREQAEAWADLRWYADGRAESENTYEGRLVEPYCPVCRDRTVAHEVGECPSRAEKGTPTSTSTGTARVVSDHRDPLRRVPASEYVPVLTGVVVSSNGRCRCPMPLHRDEHPSAKVYGARVACFSECGRSFDIYELGAGLYGLGLTGADFLKLRRRLAAALLDGGVYV
jgi:hypothetical protein